jgi:ferredoxin
MKVRVDAHRCQGHTLCAMIAPDIFTLNDIDGSSNARTETVPPDQQALVAEAARSCPEQAIQLDTTHSPTPTQNTRETPP